MKPVVKVIRPDEAGPHLVFRDGTDVYEYVILEPGYTDAQVRQRMKMGRQADRDERRRKRAEKHRLHSKK